jgi:hypothetical protein
MRRPDVNRRPWEIVLGVIGVVGTIVTVVELHTPRLIALILTCIGLAIAAALFVSLRREENALPDELAETDLGKFVADYVVLQATEEDVAWSADLARRAFRGSDLVPDVIRNEWHRTNPYTYWVVKKNGREPVGYTILLPLRPNTLKHVEDGDLLERNILGDNIFTPAERDSISSIYIASLVVMNERNNCVPKAVAQFMMSCEEVLEKLCHIERLQTIYATAASRGGKRLLERFDFMKIRDGSQRKDHHDLYRIDYQTLRRHINQLSDSATRKLPGPDFGNQDSSRFN